MAGHVADDPIAAEVAAELRHVWWVPVLRGVVLLALGLLMLFHPLETVSALVWAVGLFVVVDGVLLVVQAVLDRHQGGVWWEVLGGLVAIAVGLVLLFWPHPSTAVLFYLVATWTLLLGLFAVIASVVLHHQRDVGWFLVLAVGLVNLVFGLLLVTNPQTSLSVIAVLVGLFAFVAGVLQVVAGFAARSFGKELGRSAIS